MRLNLSDQEKKDLVTFLKALDGQAVCVTITTDFPQ